MVQILCTKVQKLEILTKTQRLALSCGHVTMGPAHRDGCPARRLYITLVNGVMRGGLCVCRLARPNCHTLTLSFLQVDGVRTSPTPASSRPHCTPKPDEIGFFHFCHMSSVPGSSDGRGPVTRNRVPDREEKGKPINDARHGRCHPLE